MVETYLRGRHLVHLGSKFRRVGKYHLRKSVKPSLDRRYHFYNVIIKDLEGESTVQDSPCTCQLVSTAHQEREL